MLDFIFSLFSASALSLTIRVGSSNNGFDLGSSLISVYADSCFSSLLDERCVDSNMGFVTSAVFDLLYESLFLCSLKIKYLNSIQYSILISNLHERGSLF